MQKMNYPFVCSSTSWYLLFIISLHVSNHQGNCQSSSVSQQHEGNIYYIHQVYSNQVSCQSHHHKSYKCFPIGFEKTKVPACFQLNKRLSKTHTRILNRICFVPGKNKQSTTQPEGMAEKDKTVENRGNHFYLDGLLKASWYFSLSFFPSSLRLSPLRS